MTTVKIYKITCTKAYIASMELGTGFGLYPWGRDTEHYEGYDDGGVDYMLPAGYTLGETQDGHLYIWDPSGKHCDILLHSSGRPQLVSLAREMPVLREG